MAAKRGNGGKFAKKEEAAAPAVPITKFVISDSKHRVPHREFETDLQESELDVFKIRMQRQYAGEFGLDLDHVRID